MENNLDHLRHSAAHLLAAAIKELHPDAKPTIGPPIENGFYYDFDNLTISESDFPKIEAKMRDLVSQWNKFDRHEVTKEEALKEFENNEYKKELIEEFAQKGEKLSIYQAGSFRDLCRGGHVENPAKALKHFKLLSIAGAYWRGDEKNKMLTRVYGTAFPSKEELDQYLWQHEEAKKRDHRKIGRELDLFLISQTVGPGLPILAPRGFLLRSLIEEYLNKLKLANGIQFVWTPHIAKSDLYIQSKHWQKYDAMMPPVKIEDDEYTLKPMNCPHHFQIYLAKPRSYRELPIRYAENATVYRFEKSGELNGLLRVRSVTQDDGHWFVQHEKLDEEISRAIRMVKEIYDAFGLKNIRARISVRDPKNPDKYLGEARVWDGAEKELQNAVNKHEIPNEIGIGEAAFYGPKIDFMAKDALGREWQLTTIQLDFNQPENFDLKYTAEDGSEKRPAVLHIAFVGSLERFMGVLIEHYAGAFPLWLSPLQVKVLPISEKHIDYAKKVGAELKKAGIRYEVDDENKTVGYKIRQATLQKAPYMVIIGDKEMQNEKDMIVSVRTREGKDEGQKAIYEFISILKGHIEKFQ